MANTRSMTKKEVSDVEVTSVVKEASTDASKTKKTFKSDDVIPCKSVTNGELLYVGPKTGILYRFADYGYIEDVEYQDLLYSVRSRQSVVVKPRFVVLDDDFVEQNKELNKIYENMYTQEDINNILELDVATIMNVVPTLPSGIKDALKGIVTTRIYNGTFDSVAKIKAFDELFGTKMLLTLVNN